MATNVGIAPPDPETPVGQLRYLLSDTEYTDAPDNPGHGIYESFSDENLQTYLNISNDSLTRAQGHAYLRLAGLAAAEAVDWKSDDQMVTLSKRAEALRKMAEFYFEQADGEDAADAGSFFAIEYPFGNPYDTNSREYVETPDTSGSGFGYTPWGTGPFGL